MPKSNVSISHTEHRAAATRVARQLVESLTDRERDVLRLIGYGLDGPAIASELGISDHTANHYRWQIASKTGISRRGGLVRLAIQANVASLWLEYEEIEQGPLGK